MRIGPNAARLVRQLFVDPGETRPIWWAWLVNDLLGSSAVPSRLRTLGYIALGMDVHLSVLVRHGVSIRGRELRVGRGSTINEGCRFDNRVPVIIGERVGVGIGVCFITTDHDLSNPGRRAGTGILEPITVGRGAMIGSGATVLKGVTIGEGVVVAAGSLVNRDCLAHGLYGGVPARRLRDLTVEDDATVSGGSS